MRYNLVISALATILAAGASGLPAQSLQGAQPMTEADQSAWPAIGEITYGGAPGSAICTGTLVAPYLVLTAGHCVAVDGVPMQAATIHFAANWRDGKSKALRRGAEILLAQPSAGQPRTLSQDVALVVLDAPIDSVEVPPLPLSRQDLFSEDYSFIGYRRDAPSVPVRNDDCPLVGTKPGEMLLSCSVVSGNSGATVLTQRHGVWQIAGVMVAQAGGDGPVKSFAVIPGDDLRARIAQP